MAGVKRKSVTIKDVAEAAGVSTATVSRTLNGMGNVPPATRELVETVVDKLNYQHTPSHGRDRQTGQMSLGVIIPDMLNPFFASLLNGIVFQSRRHGLSVEIGVSDNDLRVETKIVRHFLARNVNGLIITPSDRVAPYLGQVRESRTICLFTDRIVDHADNWVVSDDFDGSYQATRYLIDLRHRQILFIGGKSRLSTERDRLAGFRKAMLDAGISLDEKLISEVAFDAESAYAATRDMFTAGRCFSAVMAGDDLIAIGVKRALEERGYRIPDDISLMGYGDMNFSRYLSLSTVLSPSGEIGRTAFLAFLDFLYGRVEQCQQIKLRPSLVIRSSCSACELE